MTDWHSPQAARRIRRFTRWSILGGLLVASAILAIVAAVGTVAAPAEPAAGPTRATETAPEQVPYPYVTATRVGPWGFYTSHSTDYVAWRFFQRDVDFSSRMTGPNGKIGNFGDPGNWASNAADIGFRVDGTPRPGSIAQWAAGEQGAPGAGHVAYVERVNADGSVVISEFDWSVEHGYSQRGQSGTSPVRAPRYIHVRDA